ncbi:hypothetical protein DB31_5202 [Hyalangium minutum]|uniref:ADYC domain-containing protein n=2 Tax=Hyalangium minutum TaxID=394096 RepID=A0A085WR47_9BACT|nr:hypothetical protein DB31_5202 [Hyalangium minutum]
MSWVSTAAMSLLALTLTVGCGEPLEAEAEAEALGQQEAPMGRLDTGCTSGNCSDPTNGQGIYIAKGFGYCIWLHRDIYFCPEYFSQSQSGPQLTGQTVNSKGESLTQAVTFPVAGRRLGLPVDVLRIGLNAQDLVIAYKDASGYYELSGTDLGNLELDLQNSTLGAFSLRFRPAALDKGVMLYEAEYIRASMSAWAPTCQDSAGKVAFIPERRVDPVTAKVAKDTDSGVVTMACRTGAIATCMVWGYRPHEVSDPERQSMADTAYATCLQAKRAAYFVQSGDYASYTTEGTHIALQDLYGIMNVSMPGVEAVWGPEGARCFSESYRRIPNPGAVLPALPTVIPVPACDQRLHTAAQSGTLQSELREDAPLATGPYVP